MYSIYFSIAVSISERKMYSSAWCERDDSPGPILIASEFIRIQFDVVGEENVSIPNASVALSNGESTCVADERFVRFRAFKVLLHID